MIEWDNPEQTILRATYEGEWVLEEYQASLDQGVAMTRAAGHRVDIIVHTLDVDAQTPPLWGLRSWRYAVINAPPNAGVTVIVPASAGVRAFAFALNRVAGQHYYGKIMTADTLEEARLLIQTARAD